MMPPPTMITSAAWSVMRPAAPPWRRQGLDRGLAAQPADLLERHLQLGRQYLGGGQPAHPALAAAHADAAERLGAVHLGRAQLTCAAPDFASRDGLAAADHGGVGQGGGQLGGVGERGLQPAAEARVRAQLAAQVADFGVRHGQAPVPQRGAGCQAPGQFRRVGAAYHGAVTCHIDAGHGAAPVHVQFRQPVPSDRIEGEAAPGQVGQLRFGPQPEAQSDRVAGDAVFAAGGVPQPDRGDAAIALDLDGGDAGHDRDASPAKPGGVGATAGQQARAWPPGPAARPGGGRRRWCPVLRRGGRRPSRIGWQPGRVAGRCPGTPGGGQWRRLAPSARSARRPG